ncbi:MAG: hypothetical protein IT437_04100 [Phycisphaerales bacterium]|nr:hypothetical protein [Phycisphaerales bacterium]
MKGLEVKNQNAHRLIGNENICKVMVKGGREVVIERRADGLWHAEGVAPHRNLRFVRKALQGITVTV